MCNCVVESSAPILRMAVPDSKVTSLIWGTLDHTIITGHEDGAITQWDLRVCSLYVIIVMFIMSCKFIYLLFTIDWKSH